MSRVPSQPAGGFPAWYKRQSRVGRLSFILTAAIVAMLLLGFISHILELIFLGPIILLGLILSPLLIILLYRWVTRRLLWKVRNRLIVTYALMSLAPIVLCLTLFGVAAYIFGGQFATNSALTLLDQASVQLREETDSLALFAAAKQTYTGKGSAAQDAASTHPLWIASADSTGTLRPLLSSDTGDQPNPFAGQPLPSWLHSGFHRVVGFQGKLYLCSFDAIPLEGGRTLSVLGARPLDKQMLDVAAAGLGRVLIIPHFMGAGNGGVELTEDGASSDNNINVVFTTPEGKKKIDEQIRQAEAQDEDRDHLARVDGGTLPPAAHLIDPPVVFSAPFTITSWQTGGELHSIVAVFSRPSTLYTRLFSTTNGLGVFIRIFLGIIATFFALLELFALLMAAGLSRTITHSVAELYQGTREIDRGNFDHRIVIKRKDQLGALANSFNGMTASIVDLMEQQREKERLLSELSIAREVQANLFPHSPVSLPGFEIHAVCQPARTVSGDYFDFIIGRHGNDLCLALGDISGKGISAALLMASLHSAVRAFGISNSDGAAPDAPTQPSPALLLELLNKHIYESTPPEKYATLFLACYDAVTRQLTYCNAGHLAPMVLSTDGTVRHLDCGGPPVGLFNGLKYQQDTIELHSGDLLIAFSDGLTEPEQNDEQFGEDRLIDCIREHLTEPLPVLAAHTLQRLQEWIGTQEQPDDMTLLLARQM